MESKIEINSKIIKGFEPQCVSMATSLYILYLKCIFHFERLYILILVLISFISFESYLVYEINFEAAYKILAKQ